MDSEDLCKKVQERESARAEDGMVRVGNRKKGHGDHSDYLMLHKQSPHKFMALNNHVLHSGIWRGGQRFGQDTVEMACLCSMISGALAGRPEGWKLG